jgi:hypothetical protein
VEENAMAVSPLDRILIAKPCPASWEGMTGDARVRFCGECRLNVFNLSGMSREAALALIEEKQGNLCVRLFQRQDGTLIPENCPVGLAALKRQVGLASAAVFALLSLAIGGIMGWRDHDSEVAVKPPVPTKCAGGDRAGVIMGRISVRPMPPVPTPPATPALGDAGEER